MANLQNLNQATEGILIVNKPKGKTSFDLVAMLRKRLGVKKIGHAGTLDPFATGVMIMLVGRNYTRLADQFMAKDKEYLAQLHLGIATDTYDSEGVPKERSDLIPSLEEIQQALKEFQGEIEQIPPMYSAKKFQGKKLYELARKGIEIERRAAKVRLHIEFLCYQYPYLELRVSCSKGTYIRSLAHDLGKRLGCGAHLSELQRTKNGSFSLEDCIDGASILNPEVDIVLKNLFDQ